MNIKLKVANLLLEFRKKFPTDLLVHTNPMYEKFFDQDSSFARKIKTMGIDLFERMIFRMVA
jgi:uncharacterized protein